MAILFSKTMAKCFVVTNSLKKKKKVFDVCVFSVLCEFVSGLILWFLDNLWFDDLRAACIGNRLNIVAVM